MALTASIAITGVAIGLLLVYGADVAVANASPDSDYGFLPLDHMQRGAGLGGPALVLPIIAFFISRKEPSRGLGAMIVAAGVLIIVGGVAVLMAGPPPTSAGAEAAADHAGRNPAMSAAMLFGPAGIQIALGGIKIARS